MSDDTFLFDKSPEKLVDYTRVLSDEDFQQFAVALLTEDMDEVIRYFAGVNMHVGKLGGMRTEPVQNFWKRCAKGSPELRMFSELRKHDLYKYSIQAQLFFKFIDAMGPDRLAQFAAQLDSPLKERLEYLQRINAAFPGNKPPDS
jgi:hypothetical protein